jgi:hypothetical protein
MTGAARPPRRVARTVLVVGEGDAERVFLQHLKLLYVERGSGVVVTLKNAHGKGAAHVVDVGIRQSRNAAFDVKAVVLDADTDWNDKTRAMAKKAKVLVYACDPCLEATLLAVYGWAGHGQTSAQLKQVFVQKFGAAASEPAVYPKHFKKAALEAARQRVAVLNSLINMLQKGVADAT